MACSSQFETEVRPFHVLVDESGISTRFYAPHGYGLDAAVGAGLVLRRKIEARLGVDYAVESVLFAPPAGATFAAGGALDQLYGARLGVAFTL